MFPVTGPYSITSYSTISTEQTNEIIVRSNGLKLNVGDILEALVNVGFIVPDKELIEKSPALKEAYNEYQVQLTKALPPQLRIAIESYKFTEKLIRGEQ